MNFNVFTDFHHASLLNSFILLFEKRLGGKVYRPIGMEWADNGFWKVYDHPATQQQYLAVGGATPDGTPPLNEMYGDNPIVTNGGLKKPFLYFCQDIDSGYFNKAITMEGFMKLPIDIVIASLPQHIEPFKRLCELHPNKPKFIYQIGNAWNVEENIVKNVMASAIVDNVPEGINFISYHQEFDTNIFHPNDFSLPETKNIYSFVNVFQNFPDWSLFLEVEKLMPDYSFRAYGGQCRDGAANGSKELADKMREARFIWHTKEGGDGYGHVLHNTAAVGKPMITKKSYYSGKLGEKLMIDGQTCIDIDGLTPQQIVDKIVYMSDPSRYKALCAGVYENFCDAVDFDKEFLSIQNFLDRLL